MSVPNPSYNINSDVFAGWMNESDISISRRPVNSFSDESICEKYVDLIHSPSKESAKTKEDTEPTDRPFDFFDDEEFAFGINLLNHNVACVGENVTKLIQMAQEPWPDNVKLFQPYEVEQILLPDNASCLAVQAFLKMCNLPFEVEMRWNAEFMSPSGRVPFIKCGAFVVSELEPIVQFAANKGVTLCGRLGTEEKAEMRAYMSLITNVLVNAELYISWVDNETFNAVTKVRNSSVYPWPLGWLQTRAKRNNVIKRLKALHWFDKSLDQVLADVEQCCNSLSQRLGEKDYFFGNTPTPIDAFVYGHMRALLSATGPKAALMIKPITNALLRHMLRVTNITEMKITPQEEYLVGQATQLTKSMTPVPRSISRTKKIRTCILKSSKESLHRDSCGFKPFASRKLIVVSSNEGNIMCEPRHETYILDDTQIDYIVSIVDDVIEKVFEIIEVFHEKQCQSTILVHDDKIDMIDDDRHDFEIITYPRTDGEVIIYPQTDLETHPQSQINELEIPQEKEHVSFERTDGTTLGSPTNDGEAEVDTVNEYLDTIDEHDGNEVMVYADDVGDSTIHVSDDEYVDSDGVPHEKPLEESFTFGSETDDSSNKQELPSPTIDDKTCKSQNTSLSSSGSQVTLKMPSNEEISVESLLKYLRERNAAYNYNTVIDFD